MKAVWRKAERTTKGEQRLANMKTARNRMHVKRGELGSGGRWGSRWRILGRYRNIDVEGIRGLAQASEEPSSRKVRNVLFGLTSRKL